MKLSYDKRRAKIHVPQSSMIVFSLKKHHSPGYLTSKSTRSFQRFPSLIIRMEDLREAWVRLEEEEQTEDGEQRSKNKEASLERE